MMRDSSVDRRRQCETPEMLAMPVLGQDDHGCGGAFLVLVVCAVFFWAVFGVGLLTIIDWVRQ